MSEKWISIRSRESTKPFSGRFCLATLRLCVIFLLLGTIRDACAQENKDEPKPAPRVVGTVIFPPRLDVQRKSSALELFAIEVAHPSAKTGEKQTVNAEEMSRKALDFIRRSQQADGSWGDKQWPQNVGVTALCCLALFAEGNLPNVGPSGRQLTRGLEFLLDHAREDGQIVSRDVYRLGPMYDHSWATLCLLQAYGNMPWRRDMRDKISLAIQLLLKYQKVDGGWRYKMMREGASDTLVTVNVLYSLRLGVRAGFAVPQESIDRALAFINSQAEQEGDQFTGWWRYRAGGEIGSPTVAACGAIALFMNAKDTSDFEDPKIKATIDTLRYVHDRYTVNDLLEMPYVHYGAFYGSQAMYNAGNENWHPYFKKMLEVFAASQKSDGQFEDHMGNTVYPTATVAIVLLAPKGFLPLYLR